MSGSGTIEANAVVIAPWSPAWAPRFAHFRMLLSGPFPASDFRIEHIGSTAIEGLAAKPIIDILLGARSLAEIEARIPQLAALGFNYVARYNAVIPQRRYFTWPVEKPHEVHLHAVVEGGTLWRDHLLFRDALRADAGLRDGYTALKHDLAKQFRDDRKAYTDAKAGYIRDAMNRARMP